MIKNGLPSFPAPCAIVAPAFMPYDPPFAPPFVTLLAMSNSRVPPRCVTRSVKHLLRAGAVLGCAVVAIGGASPCRAVDAKAGEAVYRKLCAACHGARGEGVVEHYGKPLEGDRSLAELASFIERTMPEGEPEKCVGTDAENVAAYVYDAFYSPIAQARNRPARIELSRLTVRQYRNTIADLVRGLRWTSARDERRGLQGEYFKSRRFNAREREIDRLDPVVDFDFGEESPAKDKIPVDQFAVRWSGSIYAPETGEYEFILETDNGAQLWVNDVETPLIDGAVKSGKDVALRESLKLVGGRIYALRLEFFKSERAKEKTARVRLKWRMPGREPEVISARYLSPVKAAETLVVTTPFPPDDRSVGYERGTSVSKAWDQATTDAAIEVAGYVAAHLDELSGSKPGAVDREKKLREFCGKFAARAFRRPLTEEMKRTYVDRQFAAGGDPETSVKRVVLLTLKSPRFLYLELDEAPADAYDVASRLSYTLWDSSPDEPLLQAAATGQLSTAEQVRKQAARMTSDERTRGKLAQFFRLWLQVDRFDDLSKDARRFPDFDARIVSDLREALELFLDEVVWSERSDFRELMTADWLYLNGRLAKFYGAKLPPDAPFQKVTLNAGERAGVLTHPYLMAGYSYTASTSPIHRGVFVSRSLLGRALRPPPEAVQPFPIEMHAGLTTRERVDLQTKNESCRSCHRMINPLGFAFEHFDTVGRFRAEEQGKPINAAGTYLDRAGKLVKFADVRELAEYLCRSEEAHEAFVEQLFHELVRRPIRAHAPSIAVDLERSFAAGGFGIRNLMIEIATAAAMRHDAAPPAAASNVRQLSPGR